MRQILSLMCGLLIVSTVAARSPVKMDSTYLIDTWETEDGLPENSATAMVQDRDGYLWFGTFGGLERFDGVNFTNFDSFNTPQLPSEGIVNVYLDRSGRLWVSTTKGLVVRDGSGWHPVDGWAGDFVRTFSERGNGDLLLTTFNGLILEWNNGHLRRLPLPPGTPGGGYIGHVDQAGQWWVVRPDFIGYWNGKAWTPGPGMGSGADGCCDAHDGGMWVLSGASLRKYQQEREVKRFKVPGLPPGFWSMCEDREGYVWITTTDRGLFRVSSDGELRVWNISNGLASNGVRFVFEDAENDLWIGTSGGGLQRFKRRRFESIGTESGLPESVVHSLWPAADGSTLIGTYGGGLFRWSDGKITNIPLVDSNGTSAYVQSVLSDRRGRIWAGTFQAGLWLSESGHFRRISGDQTGGLNVIALFEDSQGRVWIDGGQGVAVYDAGTFHPFTKDSGAPMMGVRFAEDSQGTVWAASSEGVFHVQDGRFIELLVNGRPIRGVNSMWGDNAGTLWIAPAHADLLCYRAGRVVGLGVAAGLPSGDIRSILGDTNGYLWMTSTRGIVRVRSDELAAYADHKRGPVNVNLFDLEDGLPSLEFPIGTQPASARDKNGHLWFATTKGVATIDPDALRPNPRPPPIDIQTLVYYKPSVKSATVDAAPAGPRAQEVRIAGPFPKPPRLPAGSHLLEIHYAALSLPAPSKVRYQVRLEPLDADWQDVGNQRLVYFRDPGPGNYVFHVRAANDDGVWNMQGASLPFSVQPYYWQTAWFRFGVGFGLVASGAAAAWWISHRRHRRLRERHRRAHEQASALMKLSISPAVTSGNLKEAFAEITETAAGVLDVGRACISLMNEAETELRCADSFDRDRDVHGAGDMLDAVHFPHYFQVLHGDRAIDATNARRDHRTAELAGPYLIPRGISSVLDASSRAGGRVVGAIRFEHAGPARVWRDDEIGFASAVADLLAQGLLNAQRNQAHEALRESQERFRLVVEAAPNAILMMGEDGRIALTNVQAEQLFGYTRAELLGMEIERLMPERFRQAGHEYLRGGFSLQARVQPMSVGTELFGLRKDGSEFPIELHLGSIRNRDESFVLIAVVDISDRIRAEIELQQQRNELAHLSRVTMLGELSGSLAHELNQPLTAILSNAQAGQRFLAKENVDLGEVREILKDIVGEDKRASEVIRRLRLLLNKGEVNQQPLDVNELILEVLKLVRSELLNHGIVVETDLAPGLPPVSGDRIQLQQVVLNLVMNACDAMSVNARNDRRMIVRTCSFDASSIRTSVVDLGCGIPPDRIDRVFEPFYTTKPQGMGLGLAICRTIITAHRGTLSASNNPERGAAFHLTLPLTEA